jgi:hypothetical protein
MGTCDRLMLFRVNCRVQAGARHAHKAPHQRNQGFFWGTASFPRARNTARRPPLRLCLLWLSCFLLYLADESFHPRLSTSAATMQIFISRVQGLAPLAPTILAIEVELSDTVGAVTARAQAALNFPPGDQLRLARHAPTTPSTPIYNSHNTLQQLKVKAGFTLHLIDLRCPL